MDRSTTFACLVVGSRSFNDYKLMKEKLDKLLVNQSSVLIVSGGARGADALAEQYAKERCYPCEVFPANWSTGRSAGYVRNEKMHKFISTFEFRGVVAFWDWKSRGTAHNFRLVERYNNPLRVIRFEEG